MRTNIDNSIFIDAVARMKGEQRIKNNLDIANALGYSEGTISEYLNNKKPVSDKFLKRAGIHRNITWHSARHSFATLMIQISDFRTTAEFMGQSDPRSTMRYLHANNQQKVAAVSLLPGSGKAK